MLFKILLVLSCLLIWTASGQPLYRDHESVSEGRNAILEAITDYVEELNATGDQEDTILSDFDDETEKLEKIVELVEKVLGDPEAKIAWNQVEEDLVGNAGSKSLYKMVKKVITNSKGQHHRRSTSGLCQDDGVLEEKIMKWCSRVSRMRGHPLLAMFKELLENETSNREGMMSCCNLEGIEAQVECFRAIKEERWNNLCEEKSGGLWQTCCEFERTERRECFADYKQQICAKRESAKVLRDSEEGSPHRGGHRGQRWMGPGHRYREHGSHREESGDEIDQHKEGHMRRGNGSNGHSRIEYTEVEGSHTHGGGPGRMGYGSDEHEIESEATNEQEGERRHGGNRHGRMGHGSDEHEEMESEAMDQDVGRRPGGKQHGQAGQGSDELEAMESEVMDEQEGERRRGGRRHGHKRNGPHEHGNMESEETNEQDKSDRNGERRLGRRGPSWRGFRSGRRGWKHMDHKEDSEFSEDNGINEVTSAPLQRFTLPETAVIPDETGQQIEMHIIKPQLEVIWVDGKDSEPEWEEPEVEGPEQAESSDEETDGGREARKMVPERGWRGKPREGKTGGGRGGKRGLGKPKIRQDPHIREDEDGGRYFVDSAGPRMRKRRPGPPQ